MSLENIQSISVATDSSNYKSVVAKQYDNNSRIIQLQCTSGNQPMSLRGYSLKLNVLNPDNELYVVDGTNITYKDDYTVLIKLGKNTLGAKGKNKAQFIMTSGTTVLSSLTFYIIIEEDITDAIAGSEKYSILDALILRVEAIDIQAEQYMRTTKGYMETVGGTDGTGGYLGTTKQYMEAANASKGRAVSAEANAKTSETNAKTSETNASNSAALAKKWAVKSNNTAQPSDTNNAQYWAETLNDRWVEKADQTTVNGCVNSITMNDATGIFTIAFVDGTTKTIDTKLEKIAVNFDYDEENEKIVITLDDGTKKEIDLSSLISEYNFDDSDTITVTEVGETNKHVKMEVKAGSITESHLRPDYLADIKVESGNAARSVTEAKSWAIGESADGTRTGKSDAEQSSMYYSKQAKKYRDEAKDLAKNVCTYDESTGYIYDQFIPIVTSQQIDDLFSE